MTIGVLMLTAAESQDRLAAEKSVALLYNVLDERRYQLGQLARDYSWWDDAAVNLVLSPNTDWAASNIGPYMTNSFHVAASLVLDPADKQALAFLRGVPADHDVAKQFLGGLDRLANDARQAPAEAPAAVTGFLRLGDEIHIAAVSLVVPARADLRDAYGSKHWAHVLVLTQSLDDDTLESIGKRYGLTDLTFRTGGTAKDPSSLLLVAPDGQELGSLTWKAETPGIAMLRRLLLPVALAFDVMVIIAILIVRQIGRMNRANQRNLELVVVKNADLEQMTALQQTAFDALSDGIAVFDRDLCLVSWNSAFAEMQSCPPELLKAGVPLVRLLRGGAEDGQELCEQTRAAIAARMSAAIQRDPTPRRLRLGDDDRLLELRHVPLENGRLMLIHRDVIEHTGSTQSRERATAAA